MLSQGITGFKVQLLSFTRSAVNLILNEVWRSGVCRSEQDQEGDRTRPGVSAARPERACFQGTKSALRIGEGVAKGRYSECGSCDGMKKGGATTNGEIPLRHSASNLSAHCLPDFGKLSSLGTLFRIVSEQVRGGRGGRGGG
eukprot:761130-Hanusia_phi.AAC.1